MAMVVVPVASEIFVALLLAGGLGFTLWEIRRLAAESEDRKVLVMGEGSIAVHADRLVSSESQLGRALPPPGSLSHANLIAVVANDDDNKAVRHPRPHRNDHRNFESSWLARQLEDEDSVA